MKDIGTKKVSYRLIEKFREYFEDVPDKMTAREAVQYALYCRALDGESVAAKQINLKVQSNTEDIEEVVKEMAKINELSD
jgi:hypothetical protein